MTYLTREAGVWMLGMGMEIAREVDRLWPDEDDAGRAGCLVEEAAEVMRATTKRRHARRSAAGMCKGQTDAEWSANKRLELAQTVGVALDIAYREGWNLADEIETVLAALQARPVDS